MTEIPTLFGPTVNNKPLFGFLFVSVFVLLVVGALQFRNTPALNDTPAILTDTNLEGPVLTDDGTLAIPITEGQVIEFDLPEGGIILEPGEAIKFQLGPGGEILQLEPGADVSEGPDITIEITEDGVIITDQDGNVTHQDGQGNVVDPPTP